MPTIADIVYASLAAQLELPIATVRQREGDSLSDLGLDSQGLMQVLVQIERETRVALVPGVPDEALHSPATLAAGVAAIIAGPGASGGAIAKGR